MMDLYTYGCKQYRSIVKGYLLPQNLPWRFRRIIKTSVQVAGLQAKYHIQTFVNMMQKY